MNITFNYGQGLVTDGLIAHAEKTLMKLSRLMPENASEALVSVTLEKESGAQTSEKMWRTVLNVDHAGEHFTAESMHATAEQSIDEAIRELKRELKAANGKRQSEMKKGGSILKRLMRGFS